MADPKRDELLELLAWALYEAEGWLDDSRGDRYEKSEKMYSAAVKALGDKYVDFHAPGAYEERKRRWGED